MGVGRSRKRLSEASTNWGSMGLIGAVGNGPYDLSGTGLGYQSFYTVYSLTIVA